MANIKELRLENPFLDMEIPSLKNYQKGENIGIISSLNSDKLDSLKKAIADIQQMISERKKLNLDLFNDIEKIKTEIRNFILESGSQLSYKEKLELKKKLIELELLKLEEKLNLWRDISTLKKEQMEYEKNLAEKEHRTLFLEKLMED